MERMKKDIEKAQKKHKAGTIPVEAFVKGPRKASPEWPRSGDRLQIFKATLQGIVEALERNIVHMHKRAQEFGSWSDSHVETVALNHTLIVESIFSHMRVLEGNSHTTRAGLMQAVIMSKLQRIDLMYPPAFLPTHMTTPEALRYEGREAQAAFGSREKRGAAFIERARGTAQDALDKQVGKEQKARDKLSKAHEMGGSIVYENHNGEKIERALEPGECLSPLHFRVMGAFLPGWLEAVVEGQRKLQWTDECIKNQLVLVIKDKTLLKHLKNVPEFGLSKGSIFAKADGVLPVSSGSRTMKLCRLLLFVTAEAKASQHDDDDEPCAIPLKEDDVRTAMAAAEPRRRGSKAKSDDRGAGAEQEVDKLAVQIQAAARAATSQDESRFHPGRGESTSSSGSDLEAPGPPVFSEWLSLSSSSSGEEEVEREEEEERRRNSVKEGIRGEEEEEKEENGGGRRREEEEQEKGDGKRRAEEK